MAGLYIQTYHSSIHQAHAPSHSLAALPKAIRTNSKFAKLVRYSKLHVVLLSRKLFLLLLLEILRLWLQVQSELLKEGSGESRAQEHIPERAQAIGYSECHTVFLYTFRHQLH